MPALLGHQNRQKPERTSASTRRRWAVRQVQHRLRGWSRPPGLANPSEAVVDGIFQDRLASGGAAHSDDEPTRTDPAPRAAAGKEEAHLAGQRLAAGTPRTPRQGLISATSELTDALPRARCSRTCPLCRTQLPSQQRRSRCSPPATRPARVVCDVAPSAGPKARSRSTRDDRGTPDRPCGVHAPLPRQRTWQRPAFYGSASPIVSHPPFYCAPPFPCNRGAARRYARFRHDPRQCLMAAYHAGAIPSIALRSRL